MVKSIIY